jgi:hypothetical protein
MGVVIYIAVIGLFLLLVSCAIAFWLIPKFARNKSVSWPGVVVIVFGMAISFLYYPTYDEQRKKEIVNTQYEHLKKSISLRIYKTAANVAGVFVEDSSNRGQYQPWNRPLLPCYKNTCDPMLPNEEQPHYAIRSETLSPHSPFMQVVPGVNIFVCRITIYNRNTGEILSRLFEYSGACSGGYLLSDQEKSEFQSVLKPASLNETLTTQFYDLAPGIGRKEASSTCQMSGTISVAPGLTQSDVIISKSDLALIFTLKNGGDSITCSTYFWADQSFRSSDYPVMKFSDGSVLNKADINRKLGLP